MGLSKHGSLVKRAVRVLGLIVYVVHETSLAFVTLTTRYPSIACHQSSATLKSAVTTVVSRQFQSHTESTQRHSGCVQRWQHQAQNSRARRRSLLGGVQSGDVASGAAEGGVDGGWGGEGGHATQTYDGDEDIGMAPVDLDQSMGSFSPEWNNATVRADPREHVIKGSVIAANQTEFPHSIDSFPPLLNSEVYYNGTSKRFWWNQNAEAVCVYAPVPTGFDPEKVEFVAKSRHVSFKVDGEEVLDGTLFYRINGYESLFVVDLENKPPYVQLELFKVREYQNWEDLTLEGSAFTPGGSQ